MLKDVLCNPGAYTTVYSVCIRPLCILEMVTYENATPKKQYRCLYSVDAYAFVSGIMGKFDLYQCKNKNKALANYL